ncbi:hypothetical protein [Streptacidiphilus neutrinimicus]|uniref:hypothetical protein n=1 Tax=Streptacidiphilus neutrinimicus TaxID=105420 RepID=UPI0005A71414|nr:hypothetical protein [Streptacidiphilus neutrinimicus]
MSRAHAVEIVLTRALTCTEMDALEAPAPGHYAFSSEGKRAIMVVVASALPEAMHQAWQQAVAGMLPLDVIWSVYPDSEGRVLLSLTLDTEVAERLHGRAEHAGLSLDALVEEALREALKLDARQRRNAARAELGQILRRYSLEELLRALLAAPPPIKG